MTASPTPAPPAKPLFETADAWRWRRRIFEIWEMKEYEIHNSVEVIEWLTFIARQMRDLTAPFHLLIAIG